MQETVAEAKREVMDVRERLGLRIREAAEAEARALRFERDARTYAEELSTIRETMEARITTVTEQLQHTTKTAAVQLETMSDELRLRREKQVRPLVLAARLTPRCVLCSAA